MKKRKIVVVIPARYASTRLAEKPLVDLCGKPMIQRVYERASQAVSIDRVIVATDHIKIAEAVKKFGGEVVMTPADLRSGTDRTAFVARDITDNDIVVNVQGDEPLIPPEMIDEAVRPMMADPDITAGTLVRKIVSADEIMNPNTIKVVLDREGFAVYFSRSPIPYYRDKPDQKSWHLGHTYYKHIGLYVFNREFLLNFASWRESVLEKIEKLEQLRIIENGYKIKAAITEYDSIPVDTIDDVHKVRKMIEQKEGTRS